MELTKNEEAVVLSLASAGVDLFTISNIVNEARTDAGLPTISQEAIKKFVQRSNAKAEVEVTDADKARLTARGSLLARALSHVSRLEGFVKQAEQEGDPAINVRKELRFWVELTTEILSEIDKWSRAATKPQKREEPKINLEERI